jgi:hypothetical protein
MLQTREINRGKSILKGEAPSALILDMLKVHASIDHPSPPILILDNLIYRSDTVPSKTALV